jgi:hypothetical protein
VHDAAGVRRAQPLRDLLRQIDRLADGQRPRAGVQPISQGLAFQQLRHQVVDVVGRRYVVDGENVWVVERRRVARLAGEALEGAACATSAGSTFSATSRARRESWARYTSPMPPAPSGDKIV